MKLTIVILGILGMLMGSETQAAKPKPKPAPKAAAKAATKTVAKKTVVKKTAARPVAKTVARTPAKAAPAKRLPATNSGMAYHSTSSTKPAADAPKQASFNDQAKIADSLKAMSAPRMATGSTPTGGGGSVMRGGTHEIGEALRVTGQSRNLSMGLLFSKDNDKIEFGNPRLHYKDKISSKLANY